MLRGELAVWSANLCDQHSWQTSVWISSFYTLRTKRVQTFFFLWLILMQIEARSSYKKLLLPRPSSHQASASQIPREHIMAGKKCFIPDPVWNKRRKLTVRAAAGITSNLQEKPSRDTKTDLFLCLLQHICLGWDFRPFPYWQTSASSVCFWRLLHLCPTHAHSRGSCFISCSDCSTFLM